MSRILVITTSYPSLDDDSAGHFVRAEVNRSVASGNDVTVIAPRAERIADRVHVIGLPHLGAFGSPGALSRLRGRPDRWLGAFLFVMTARFSARKLGPFDHTILHFIVPGSWPISTALPGPLEVVVHGSDLGLLERMPRLLRNRVLRPRPGVRRTFRCVSTNLAQRLARLLPPSEAAYGIRVEPSPIDIPALQSRDELRKTLNLGTEELIVIVSRLVPSKRVELALHAASATRATIVVCGDGPERARLERGFPKAHFCGQVPRQRALEWIAVSNVVLSASLDEGAPTVVREARALGVPVVAAEAGDLLEWARSDPGILVVTRENQDQIQNQIQDQGLIQNQVLIQNLQQALLRVLKQEQRVDGSTTCTTLSERRRTRDLPWPLQRPWHHTALPKTHSCR